MGNRSFYLLTALGVVLLLAYNVLYTVSERERAILLRFGEVVRADIAPGLHWKVPVLNRDGVGAF